MDGARRSLGWQVFALIVWLGLPGVRGAEAWRQEVSLNGPWEAGVTRDAQAAGPAAWEPVTVPHLREGLAQGGSDFLWYRREVTVPASWAGGRIALFLVGARYHPRVCVDGKTVAERLDGWTPFEVDLTALVQVGKPFVLSVRCQDWGATFAEGYTLPADVAGDLREAPKAQLLEPIGGHYGWFGMWDDVVLLRRPPTYLDDVAIVPSVRRMELAVRGQCVQPRPGLRVGATVFEGEQALLQIPPVEIGVDGRWELLAAFPQARFWSPEDPHLYALRLTLTEAPGEPVDELQERFGFRELWAEGPDFVLNGVRRHLLASSGWPVVQSQSAEEIRENIKRLRSANVIAFRLHTQPWQRRWLEAADELGLMLIEEGALWCDSAGSYRYQDRRFWENTWEHLSGMVRRDRNHASLVMWSIENELLQCGAARYYPECEAELADLGRRVKALDPGHLITFEADLDPKGVADVIGLHYPHEMPEHYDYPNTADWLNSAVTTGTGGGLLGSRGAAFRWDRQKPLYIGEYLWVPYNDYSPGSVFFGDAAYLDRERYKRLAVAESWLHQTVAYRRAGVSGMCPWTFAGSGGRSYPEDPLFEVQQHVYVPVAIYRTDLQRRYFAGDQARFRFDVFNDSVQTRQLSVVLEVGGTEVARSEVLELAPADYRQMVLEAALPGPTGDAGTPLRARLLEGGKELHCAEDQLLVTARAPLRLPAGMDLLLFDPGGTWSAPLGDLPQRRIGSLEALATADCARALLLVAPGALAPPVGGWGGAAVVGVEAPGGAALRAFLLAGGRALFLEQESLDGLSLGVELVEHASTMVFPTALDHPFLAGLTEADLRFWAGDHYVSRREVRRPTCGGALPLLVSGGAQSLSQSALLDGVYGAGRVVFCQALVGTKLDTEPAARRLLQNLLDGLAPPRPSRRPTLLLAEGADADGFAKALQGTRVEATAVSGPLSAQALAGAGLLILHGGGPRLLAAGAGLAAHLAAGGTVYWHAPDADTFAALRAPLGAAALRILPGQGPLTIRAPWTGELAGVCLEDLAFVGPLRGDAWMRGFDLDPAVADRIVSPEAGVQATRRYEVEAMARDGTWVQVNEGGTAVVFASAGTASGPAEVPKPGLYVITLIAGGTSAQGGWPQAAVSWDGKTVALVGLTGGDVRSYSSLAELPGGAGKLGVAFVNDLQSGREDRNLTVDAVLVGAEPLEAGGNVRFLNLPPATAVIAVGSEGRVVVDGVRWDAPGGNRERGRRYASALLRNLGAVFLPPEPEGAWVGPASFKPVGTVPYYSQDTERVALVAAGSVTAVFESAQAGRYEVLVKGWSQPAAGEYARAAVRLDDVAVGEVEMASGSSAVFVLGNVTLRAGPHRLTVEYTNDLWKPPEDRNLYLQSIGFRRVEAP
jgi:hypothetical protein